MTAATDLHALADRLERLAPSHRDPHRYFEEKSELVAELRRLAQSGNLCPIEDRRDAYRLTMGGTTCSTHLAANDNHPRRTAA